jgi:hypothetical protein
MLRSIISKSVKRSFYRQAAPSSTLRDSITEEGASWSSLHHSISDHTDPRSTKPLLEQFRPRWPQPPITKLAEADEFPGIFPIPETRSIPASVLRFSMQASFSHGASLYYEHLHYNPADFKVTLRVSTINIVLL